MSDAVDWNAAGTLFLDVPLFLILILIAALAYLGSEGERRELAISGAGALFIVGAVSVLVGMNWSF